MKFLSLMSTITLIVGTSLNLPITESNNSWSSKYTPDWESLDSRPLPEWYDDAKIGIFMHFGPYAVPGVRSEWFWIDWYKNDSLVVDFMKDNYPPNFTYQDFGVDLKMEFFNASWFADLIKDSGAKYLVFTSKHHDGFTNWPSPYTFGWNSMDIGPRRDVLHELRTAFHQRHPDLHFGLYYSLFEWFNPIYLKDKSNNYATREYPLNKMMPEMMDLVTKYQPDVIWSDGDWEAEPEYWGSKDFLAWLYNDSPVKDTVVVNDRWGRGTAQKHGGFYSGPDRFVPGHVLEHKFEDAMTVDRESWGIRRDIKIEEVYPIDELIGLLAEIVSCNGNLLVNVGPTKEGTIIPIFQERLRQMGGWLGINGEAIYKTRPWTYQNDSLSADPQVWYTKAKEGSFVYGISVGWPTNNENTLILGDIKTSAGTEIMLLGYGKLLHFVANDDHVVVQFPPMHEYIRQCGKYCQWGYVLKMTNLANVSPMRYQDNNSNLIEEVIEIID